MQQAVSRSVFVARHAVERDPQNVKAYMRAGGAQMGLQHSEEAVKMYGQALLLDKANTAAQVPNKHGITQQPKSQ